jgi:hypothetical protein
MSFTYLGLPVGTTKPTVQDLMPLVDRIERRVSATFLMMSYSGRVTVINSLLSSIATFTMCSIQLNPKILEHVEKIRRHCLWNKKTDDGEKCNSLAAWDMVCRPKKKGGLGILNLKLQNQGLLLKYLHKFYNKTDTPWVHLIWNSYYFGKVPHTMSPCGSFWWREIFKLTPIYRGITKILIGDGSTALFWKDNWKDGIHSEMYPRAFSYARNEDVSIQDFLTASRLSDNFYLPLSPQALEETRNLQNDVTRIEMATNGNDKWTYAWGSDIYSSKSFYQYCFRELQPHITFSWLWKTKCVPKMKFFCWLILSDRLNTRNMLRRRHYILNSGYNCLLCISPPEETIEHLFFHCQFSTECWSTLNLFWQQTGDRCHIIEQGRSQWTQPMFMEIFIVAAWSIWKERNNWVFNNKYASVQRMTQVIRDEARKWAFVGAKKLERLLSESP